MKDLIVEFNKIFKDKPEYLISAPSRANLAGAHVDYFEGVTVSIASANLKMKGLVRLREDSLVRFYSNELDGGIDILEDGDARLKFQPLQYIQGCREMFKKYFSPKNVKGFDLLISSTIPIGGGMSSSSALSVIGATVFSLANGLRSDEIILEKIAHIAGEAEWWYGTRGGKMDQFTISLAKKDQALVLDNRDYSYKYVSWPGDSSIAVCNTNVPHNQKRSGFANRREQAERGLVKIKKYFNDKNIKTFRDISLDMLEEVKPNLTKLEYRRVYHPVSEIELRTPKFIKALEKDDSREVGKLLSQIYFSLRDNYGTSCAELDLMYRLAKDLPGFLGGRITGGGFGGCLIALVKNKSLDGFLNQIKTKYNQHDDIRSRNIKGQFIGLKSGDGLKIAKL